MTKSAKSLNPKEAVRKLLQYLDDKSYIAIATTEFVSLKSLNVSKIDQF